ncbi:MAG: hypothetical protein R2812_09475 [Gelidibacter sp.]
MKKKVLVVDLDGTLFKINTFHHFIKYLIIHCIKNFNIVLLLKILFAMVFRLLKITTHAQMKYAILKAISNNKNIDCQKFVNRISIKKRHLSILNDTSFDIKILATAAPSCYATIIAKNENFDVCLGTNFTDSAFDETFENSKEIKKNNIVNYLKNKEITQIDTLVTDHIDDLPIMKLATHNIIVSPNDNLTNKLKQNAIAFETIL